MAKIVIDRSLCDAYGECLNPSNGLIELDDQDIAYVVDPDHDISDSLARDLVTVCPAQAILLANGDAQASPSETASHTPGES